MGGLAWDLVLMCTCPARYLQGSRQGVLPHFSLNCGHSKCICVMGPLTPVSEQLCHVWAWMYRAQCVARLAWTLCLAHTHHHPPPH